MAYATTTNLVMRAALAHYGTVFSFGRVPQTGELSGVAALCLTPDSWVDGWNAVYRARLAVLAGGIDAINRDVGCEVFQLQHPQGGWYFALRIAQHLFGADVTSGVHAASVLLNYGQDRRDTGIAMLPGELFGYGLDGPQRWLDTAREPRDRPRRPPGGQRRTTASGGPTATRTPRTRHRAPRTERSQRGR